MLETLLDDARHAWRGLTGSPSFTAVAVATIALGIGVNTGIFSLFNAMALRELPVPGADELVTINQQVTGVERGSNNFSEFSTAEYEVYRDNSETLSGVAGYARYWNAALGPEPRQVVVSTPVTCDYFDVLQRQPTRGTGFAQRHCQDRSESAVAVLTHDLWVDRFGADPAILGQTITLNASSFTVIGIAPEGFAGVDIERVSLFVPVSAQPLLRQGDRDYLGNPAIGWLGLVGRRAPGATIEQVRAELTVIAEQFDREQPGRETTVAVSRATPLSAAQMRRNFFGVSPLLMAPFGLVLLVACMNVANLLLARGDARLREIAIKLSLGATRGHIARQLLIENITIALIGGALSTVLAVWVFQLLLVLAMGSLPADLQVLRVDATLDFRVLSYAFLISLGTGLAFGIVPALRATKPDLRTTIERDSAGAGHHTRGRLQRVLVGGQVAFSMVLVVTTALLLRGLYVAQTVDFGFDGDVKVASYDLRGFGYEAQRAAAFQQQIVERVSALPGVDAVAQALIAPLARSNNTFGYRLPDQQELVRMTTNVVSANYFSVVGIPIVRGRTFSEAEIASPRTTAMILTQSTAQRLWPDQDPLQQRLVFAGPAGEQTVDIVGVAADRQVARIGETDTSYVYSPAVLPTQTDLSLVIHSQLDVTTVQRAVEAIMRSLDPALSPEVIRLEENFEFWRRFSRLAAGVALSLGALALTLAAVGIFGVMSTVVGRRIREIGIRLALGANKRQILRLVLEKSMVPVVVGALIGCGACVVVARLLGALLYGVSPIDPYALGGALLIVLGIGVLVTIAPARRAMVVEPMTTLRYE